MSFFREHSGVLLALGFVIASIGAKPLTVALLSSDSAFRKDVVALAWDAKARASDIGSLEAREQFYAWYLGAMQALIRRHAEAGSEADRRSLALVAAVYDDVGAWIKEAGAMRKQRREVQLIALSRYTDTATYESSRQKCEAIAAYLSDRKARFAATKEAHRKRISDSGLDVDDRTALWQPLSHFYELIDKETLGDAGSAESYRGFMRLLDFLHEHRTQFKPGEDRTLKFGKPALTAEFRSLALQAGIGL